MLLITYRYNFTELCHILCVCVHILRICVHILRILRICVHVHVFIAIFIFIHWQKTFLLSSALRVFCLRFPKEYRAIMAKTLSKKLTRKQNRTSIKGTLNCSCVLCHIWFLQSFSFFSSAFPVSKLPLLSAK